MRNPRFTATFASMLLVVALAACGGGSSSTATSETSSSSVPPVAGHSVVIKDFAFIPADLQVKVGDKVTVTNEDSAVHTLTADDKSFDTGPLRKGQSATITVTKAGANPYICTPHPYMVGTITAS